MEFRVLGPFEVLVEGRSVDLGGTKRRAVLAVLALHANEVVSTDRLVDELWGEKAPRNAGAALHNHVSRIRKALGPDAVVTKPWGYVLRADPEAIDARRFERLVREAEALPARDRAARLAEALALWRGRALEDVAFEPALAKEIARLEELRLAALEERIDADLELGRHGELVPELESLIAEHPLRERLRGQLILALYRAGRQAEALEVYRETRRVLADELGLEPSPALRDLERSILQQDPALAPPPREERAAAAPVGRGPWTRRLVIAAVVLLLALAALGASLAFVARTSSEATKARAMPAPPVRTVRVATPAAAPQPAPAAKPKPKARPPSRSRVRPKVENVPRTTPERVAPPNRVIPTTRTAPVKRSAPKRTPARPPQVPKNAIRLFDGFDDGVLNTGIWWSGTFGTGGSAVERNGRLEMTMAPEATFDPTWNTSMVQYGTRCRFPGDFDARIEFTLLQWPPASGVTAVLNAYAGDGANVSRGGHAWGEQYQSWIAGTSRTVRTNDEKGALRITRRDGVVTTYHRAGTQWVKLDSARLVGSAFVGPQLTAGSDFAKKEVKVAFDDFVIEAEDATC